MMLVKIDMLTYIKLVNATINAVKLTTFCLTMKKRNFFP